MDDSKSQHASGPLSDTATLKGVLFWIALMVLIGLGSLSILFVMEGLKIEMIVIGFSMTPILLALEFNRRNNTQLAGSIMAVSLLIMVTILATLGQGIYDISVMSYPAILIIASLILRRNSTIYLTIMAIGCLGWLIFGDIYGFYQPQFQNESYARQFYITSIILIGTAFSVQLLSETVRNNESAAQHELEERKKVELALREAEQLYRTMVEGTSVITYRNTADKVSRTIYISPQIKNALGYTKEEWMETPSLWVKCTHPDDLPGMLANIEECLESGKKTISEYRLLSKDGQWVWFQDEAVVIKNDFGEPQYIHGVLIDITKRKQAELKVKQREEILTAVASTAQQLLKSSNWRDEINAILKMLGEATNASHVYIFENHMGPAGVMLSSQRYEWAAPGMISELENPIYQNEPLNPIVPSHCPGYGRLV